jgi:glycosyltransferase involved in cell wall biosynthesis
MTTPPLLLHVFPTFATGGAQVRLTSVLNHLGTQWRHAIVAMDGVTTCRERLDPGLDVTFPVVTLPKRSTWGNIRRCRAVIRALAPDVLVTSNWGSIEWAMANLLPLARHVHVEDGLGPDEVAGQLPRRVWTRRAVLRRSTVVLPSRVLEHIALDTWRLPRRRIRYIPNGVDLARFGTPSPISDRPPVIGTVAALRPEKNIGRLLQAFASVRQAMPARLVIVGDGPERASLEMMAAALGVAEDVGFTGHLPEPRLEYAGFDLFALSSETEQMPLSVLEAMAAHLPIVATDVGDIRVMLSAENTPFIVQRDPEPLAAALMAVLCRPDRGRSIGAANRLRAEAAYSQDAMFAAWSAVLSGSPVHA